MRCFFGGLYNESARRYYTVVAPVIDWGISIYEVQSRPKMTGVELLIHSLIVYLPKLYTYDYFRF